MSARLRRIAVVTAFSLLTAACAARPDPDPATPVLPAGKAPDGCTREFPQDAPLLKLDPTREPDAKAQKSQPFQFANEIKVRADLTTEGAWTRFDDGWSMLALRVTSPGAKSLSLHLTELALPPRTQIWLCSADNRLRQGPYRDAAGGELWTPVVLGDEARLQIDVPTAAQGEFEGRLAEAFGGFR